MTGRCLIADADLELRSTLRRFIEPRGWEALEARNAHEARELLRRARPDVVLLEEHLPGGHLSELLPEWRASHPSVPLLVLATTPSIDGAVQAIKLGAEQFVPKPVEPPALLRLLEHALEAQRTRAPLLPDTADGPDPFLGVSPLIRQLEATVRRVLDSDRALLLLGETGTGKGMLASWIHLHGPRASAPLVQLNCAGLAPQLLETELFGHERGAFTSAIQRKLGLLEVAHKGSLFLDEVGDMDPLVQPKLLKVLEERRFRRLGEVEERTVDIRLIAATHQNLVERVRAGRFRGDLYFRISTLPLRLPALRERPEDIPIIARDMLERLSLELGRPGLGLTGEAEASLRGYTWPGNLRELRNVLERAALLAPHSMLRTEDMDFNTALAAMLPGAPTTPVPESELSLTLREVERRHISRVLAAEGGHVGRAAQRLGIPRSSLYQKLKSLGLSARV
ncbi:sigma-54-dependent Fis family transcriptional regulator [Cystobacter fuscus]|uniref:Sigma-54-dependent Fis family transcriptional regulator n=1 Tax=Cystobacter fuscus TaxID=43 RepID=A0A250IXH6_9BACT|nr:sigma-54 dependent transcriptional regulator [Cystobacter fuscus]ATB36434.1 sigma-54-dependent Fis family transcriptional regulator [Cystobacter fuscus]